MCAGKWSRGGWLDGLVLLLSKIAGGASQGAKPAVASLLLNADDDTPTLSINMSIDVAKYKSISTSHGSILPTLSNLLAWPGARLA